MTRFRESCDLIEQMVKLMKESGKCNEYIIGYLIASKALTMSLDLEQYAYNYNIKSLNNRIKELTDQINGDTVSTQSNEGIVAHV